MSYSVIPTPFFKKQAKRLSRKYRSLKQELEDLAHSLSDNPAQGKHMGNNIFKVRLAVKSKGKGKSGGMRIISYLLSADMELYLLTIYDKSEIDSVDDKTLQQLISEINP